MASILIIDDEEYVLQSLEDTLKDERFEVHTAIDGAGGIKSAKDVLPDVILLDLRLPDMDGYEVCRALKKEESTHHIPILMVSTRSKNVEKVVGLEMGADDYITKPFNSDELLARIRAVLRRVSKKEAAAPAASKSESHVIVEGEVEVDKDLRHVSVSKKEISLTPKEYDILLYLISSPGKTFQRRQVLSAVWGEAYETMSGTLGSHIKSLRKKLGPAGSRIETITGIGYRWKEK